MTLQRGRRPQKGGPQEDGGSGPALPPWYGGAMAWLALLAVAGKAVVLDRQAIQIIVETISRLGRHVS